MAGIRRATVLSTVTESFLNGCRKQAHQAYSSLYKISNRYQLRLAQLYLLLSWFIHFCWINFSNMYAHLLIRKRYLAPKVPHKWKYSKQQHTIYLFEKESYLFKIDNCAFASISRELPRWVELILHGQCRFSDFRLLFFLMCFIFKRLRQKFENCMQEKNYHPCVDNTASKCNTGNTIYNETRIALVL